MSDDELREAVKAVFAAKLREGLPRPPWHVLGYRLHVGKHRVRRIAEAMIEAGEIADPGKRTRGHVMTEAQIEAAIKALYREHAEAGLPRPTREQACATVTGARDRTCRIIRRLEETGQLAALSGPGSRPGGRAKLGPRRRKLTPLELLAQQQERLGRIEPTAYDRLRREHFGRELRIGLLRRVAQ